MIKKILHITLAFSLLVVTMGFTVSKHYCGDKLVSISVNHEAESCCDMDGCCHNETNHYQLEDDFVYSFIITDVELTGIDILFPFIFTSFNVDTELDSFTENIFSELPPPHKIQTALSLIQAYLC
jgi:hypothetical protein